MAANHLHGLGLAGFRSFGDPEPQRVGPMAKVHLLAGPNNSGKSNVLRVAGRLLPELAGTSSARLEQEDVPYGGGSVRPGVSLACPDAQARAEAALGPYAVQYELVERLFASAPFADGHSELTWFDFELVTHQGGQRNWQVSERQVERLVQVAGEAPMPGGLLGEISRHVSQQSGSAQDDARRVLSQLINELTPLDRLPPVATIDAFRAIGPADPDQTEGAVAGLNGAGLIARLAELQNPVYGRQDDVQRFEAINRFLQTLFDDAGTRLEIPHDQATILVHHDGRRLPLENYGTGLHQTVILAAAATVLQEHLVLVEEPEVHLHPRLQRKLLRYLDEVTDNQYLIATHSAHLLDAARASISAVQLSEGQSHVTPAIEADEVAAVSAALGARPSDLVQANCVVWVEGPSDRILLRCWLELTDPSLVEGVDYSVMFYGGALLTHLAAEDPAVEHFVRLPRLNRHFAVLMDRDRPSRRQGLKPAVQRIRAELSRQERGLAWVTHGYCVETYVPPDLLGRAVADVHPRSGHSWQGDERVDPLAPARFGARSTTADKVAIAGRVAEGWTAHTPLPGDLKARLKELVELIRRANA